MEPTPDPTRVAIKDFLEEDPVLKELATGVYFELAEQSPNSPLPYVIFQRPPGGTEEWTFEGEPMTTDTWIVKGVGTPKQAESIDRRCRDLLNSEELSIDGRELLFLRSQSTINYMEPVDGERYQHVGHSYTLISERTE